MYPGQAEEFEFEFVHVWGFVVKNEEEAEDWCLWSGLPAVDGVVGCCVGVSVEMLVFDALPACH